MMSKKYVSILCENFDFIVSMEDDYDYNKFFGMNLK